jgi:hypothetical protein
MWEVSYSNLLMYLATIPNYSKKGEEEAAGSHEEIGIDQLFNMFQNGNTKGQ